MKKWILLVYVVSITIMLACAPKAAPTPSAPTPSKVAVPISTPAIATTEDSEWAKVVAAAKKEGKVNIYSYNLVGDVGLAVAKAFREQYGITVDIITGRGAEFLERVRTEKRMGQFVADVNDGSSVHSALFKKEGLTINLAKELPVFRGEGAWRYDPFGVDDQDKQFAGLSAYCTSPWINTKLVRPDEVPLVWQDLLKPQWKGKMVLTEPRTSAGPQQTFVPLMRAGVIDEAFLKALYKQDLMFSSSLPDEARILARGERLLSIRGTVATYSRYVAEGAPIKAIEMKDGVVLVTSPVLLVFGDSPHPNSARLYANWLLSKEGQRAYAESASVTPIRSDVPDFAPEAARLTPQKPILQTTEDNDKASQLFRDGWLDKLWDRR